MNAWRKEYWGEITLGRQPDEFEMDSDMHQSVRDIYIAEHDFCFGRFRLEPGGES